jgi:hypothetical protein
MAEGNVGGAFEFSEYFLCIKLVITLARIEKLIAICQDMMVIISY